MLTADLHTHTVYSHGKGTPRENVLAAVSLGLESIAISEHAPGHLFYGVSRERLRALRREVDELNAEFKGRIRVLMGLECNLTGFGKCDLPTHDEGLFDVRLLAFHKGGRPEDGFLAARSLEALRLAKPDPIRTANALLAAAEKYHIDIFAHPGLYIKCDIPTLARGARELGAKLEINGARVTMSPDELHQAAKAGAKLIIGSDAHHPSRVGDDEKALRAAMQAGVADSVVNIRPQQAM